MEIAIYRCSATSSSGQATGGRGSGGAGSHSPLDAPHPTGFVRSPSPSPASSWRRRSHLSPGGGVSPARAGTASPFSPFSSPSSERGSPGAGAATPVASVELRQSVKRALSVILFGGPLRRPPPAVLAPPAAPLPTAMSPAGPVAEETGGSDSVDADTAGGLVTAGALSALPSVPPSANLDLLSCFPFLPDC